MSKLPSLKPKQIIRALVNHAGFVVDHVSGSHYVLLHGDGRRVVISYHNKDLKPGTLNSILKQIGMSREELRRIL